MQRPAIEIKKLSKLYRLGTGRTTRLSEELSGLWDRCRGLHQPEPKGEFWALRDVSFEVQRGDVVGVVGGNGAGKSTLLKILSRITQQTAGEVVLRGRVASLLEVGTGFHPDLTGRENTFLSGAILGMTRSEIKSRFDDIVAFAEIERFIDTPVKRYSSGMYVRLAFAVAAHLEPEILIVDEVLAVGDAEFQRKCLGKMRDVSVRDGRTVLFVSHSSAAVSSLCHSAVYLKQGRLAMVGDAPEVISAYLRNGRGTVYEKGRDAPSNPHAASIQKAWIEGATRPGVAGDTLRWGQSFTLHVELSVLCCQRVRLIASFLDHLRRPLWTSMNASCASASIPAGARVLVRQHYVLPPLCIPSLVVDLCTVDAAGYPFLDHVISAITVSITSPAKTAHKIKNTDFPFLVEPAQETFVLTL